MTLPDATRLVDLMICERQDATIKDFLLRTGMPVKSKNQIIICKRPFYIMEPEVKTVIVKRVEKKVKRIISSTRKKKPKSLQVAPIIPAESKSAMYYRVMLKHLQEKYEAKQEPIARPKAEYSNHSHYNY
jgi:hypothetical protein